MDSINKDTANLVCVSKTGYAALVQQSILMWEAHQILVDWLAHFDLRDDNSGGSDLIVRARAVVEKSRKLRVL